MINISKQIHAGWDSNKVIPATRVLHEAELIPEGSSKSELTKFEKFSSRHSTIKTIDNAPFPGFTLYDVDKKNYSAPDSTWLVIDPRGFMARITNKNLIKILRVSGITEGLIQQKCVWAREDSNTTLTLVPLSSADYNLAVGNTQLLEEKIDIKSVEIGDEVLLQNGLTGKYMGVLSLYGKMEKSYSNKLKAPSYLRKQIVEVQPGKFHYGNDVRILKVLSKSKIATTREESMNYINNCITSGNYHFTQGTDFTHSFNMYRNIMCASIHAEPKVKYELVEIDKAEAEILFYEYRDMAYPGALILELATGKQFVVDYPWWGNNKFTDANSFTVQDVLEKNDVTINLGTSSKGSMAYVNGAIPTTYALDKFKKFYKIVKRVRTLTYI